MLGKDLQYAARSLVKSPVFLVTAALTIALGIGASTAIFSVANAVLLRPLPYSDPDRLVLASGDMRKRNTLDLPLSNENYVDLRNGSKAAFEDMGAVFTFRNTLPRSDGSPEQVKFAQVTTNFFRLMGAKIVAGRDFDEADGQPQPVPAPGAAPAAPAQPMVILSYQYWQRRFGGNSGIIGHPMLDSAPNAGLVVGVLAPGFELLFRPSANMERTPDIWFAARVPYNNANRNGFFWRPVGRLKPGATLERAQDASEVVSTDIRKSFPIYGASNFHFGMEPMHQHLVAEVRPAILALMGAVIFLLLIACANVANLLMVRSSLRSREMSVRAALGGSRARLIRQVLAEALLLSAVGTVFGLGLAMAGVRELIAIGPANLPRLDSIRLDPVVLGFTVLIALMATVAFGLVPALRASRPDVMGVLRGGSRTVGLGGSGARNAVVVVEVALSFVLLVGSGLMFRSFLALQHVNLGYDPQNLLTFQLLGGRGPSKPEQRAASIRELRMGLASIPGVLGVTAAGPFPLTGGFSPIRWGKEDALTDPSKYQAVDNQIVLPGYFETVRTPLIAGRYFTEADNAPERNFAIIDQLFAAKAFPNESAIGKRVLIRIRTPEAEWVEIVGVVAHQLQTSLTEPGREQIYFTDGFLSHGFVGRWALRTSGDPGQYAGQVRTAIAAINKDRLIAEMQPMDRVVERAQSGTKFQLLLIGVFATIAALLAGVGLYGVLSTVVRQRTAEIGVRMALGAAPSSIFNLMVGLGLSLSASGIGFGILAALGLTRVMTSMLVGVKATDPITFGAMIVFFFLIAIVSCWIPARRAAALDPTIALRE